MKSNRTKIVSLLRRAPCTPNSQIVRTLDISRQRVSQIRLQEGLGHSPRKTKYLCLNNCGTPLKESRSKFCSFKCYLNYHHIQVTCSQCRTLFTITTGKAKRIAKLNRKYIFCSKKCQGQWLGLNYLKDTKKNENKKASGILQYLLPLGKKHG